MVLCRQLFGIQFESCDHLFGKRLSSRVPKGIQRNSCNHTIIWHHHSHWSEQSFQVVWQLRSTRVSGIHCDESAESRLHSDKRLFEHQLRSIISLGGEELLQLLCDNRQYFQIDPVELIEAGPRTRSGKTFEEFTNHDVVHPV